MRVAVMLAALILINIGLDPALAQTGQSVTAPPEAREAVHKGREAFNREDYPAALALFRSAAEQGDAEAQAFVGAIYLSGWGVQKNYAEALTWLRKSAAQGYADAQARIGAMYKRGLGVPQSDAEAALWIRKAAEAGHTGAQNAIGFTYLSGEGVPKDPARGVSWFRKAAEKGDPVGQTNLGDMYREGLGVQKDYALAATWYRKAAEKGHDDAKKKLAELERRRQAETSAANAKIPPAIQFRCFFDTTPDQNTPKRYDECLRSNWKRLMGSAPFPGD